MFKDYSGWGLYPWQKASAYEPTNYDEIIDLVKQGLQFTPRGNGRSYGDSALGSHLLMSSKLNKILSFDEEAYIITCESGVLLDDILQYAIPKGFFLPVTPGTKYISVGGALAADIHGKNHHIEGVFSDHVVACKLITKDATISTLLPADELFQQTAGGMGLTGFIVEVSFKLKKVETSFIIQEAIRAKNLKEIFHLFETNQQAPYSVAWIDSMAKGDDIGRSVLLLGKHASLSDITQKNPLCLHKSGKWTIPFFFPSWLLNHLVVKIFNYLYYYKPSSNTKQIIHYDPFFYPLDKVHHWNRMYGKKGFVQYQFVLPKASSYEGMKKILHLFAKHKIGSFLAVLKLFGRAHHNRYLHFPIEGYTLAIDIKVDERIWPILEEADTIINELGGKIYLAKDARMSKASFKKQYTQAIDSNTSFGSTQFQRLEMNVTKVFLVLGANSDIAKETVLAWQKKYANCFFILASRNVPALEKFIGDNDLNTISQALYFDATDLLSHANFVKSLPHLPNTILYAAGSLIETNIGLANKELFQQALHTNFTGAVSIINELIHANNPSLERIVAISSVAGLRGRKSNFIYGSQKAALHAYLFGLRQYLKERGILVQAVTPGFVKTKMTNHITNLNRANSPEEVAATIVHPSKRFEIYPNIFWFAIGNAIKWLPEKFISRL
jgi:FAD/FMN-containing dehydrogenase/NAD(P)-dependent dehydrogenase (short-subunit alcohol dehydrogenase family)